MGKKKKKEKVRIIVERRYVGKSDPKAVFEQLTEATVLENIEKRQNTDNKKSA